MKAKVFKKSILLWSLIMLFGLFGCGKQEDTEIKTEEPVCRFTFKNSAVEADVWIIPDTEQNRKTTVWGTATVKGSMPGTDYPIDPEDSDKYLFRMIDTDKMYYSADAVEIPENGTIEIRSAENSMDAELEVFDCDGNSKATYEVFKARL